jgi:hypothetical protein
MNLKGPWFYEWLEGPEPADAFLARCADRDSPQMSTSRVRMPASWLDAFGPVTGTVMLRRRFGQPSNLEPHERVHVALDEAVGDVEISVNGEAVASIAGSIEPLTFDVTDRLNASNELALKLRYDGRQPEHEERLLVSVAIEIHVAD